MKPSKSKTSAALLEQRVAERTAELATLVDSLRQEVVDRRAAEAELEKHRQHLEEMVKQRTAQLESANQALRKTAEELERSNNELQQFAYVASHDLQEPLRMVAGYLQLIQRRYQGRLDTDADEFIQFAVDGAGRMKTLINDLLAFSRVGTRGAHMAPTDMDQAFTAARDNLQAVIGRTGTTVISDKLPTVQADAGQLVQLLQNLLANAIKFHSERPPHIHVGARQEADEWVFSVADNGIGIEPQYFERIFVVFQRLHGRDTYPGTGIGLAICKKVVERHGGRIWVESTPDQGSTFYFSLPR